MAGKGLATKVGALGLGTVLMLGQVPQKANAVESAHGSELSDHMADVVKQVMIVAGEEVASEFMKNSVISDLVNTYIALTKSVGIDPKQAPDDIENAFYDEELEGLSEEVMLSVVDKATVVRAELAKAREKVLDMDISELAQEDQELEKKGTELAQSVDNRKEHVSELAQSVDNRKEHVSKLTQDRIKHKKENEGKHAEEAEKDQVISAFGDLLVSND